MTSALSTWQTLARLCILSLSPAAIAGAGGDQQPIIIDGVFDDWADVEPFYESNQRGSAKAIEFGRLWVTNDDRFLFLRFEVGAEILPSRENSLRLYLDTDDDPTTGLPVAGIGAELEWRFGERIGTFHSATPQAILQRHISLRISPSVSSTEFEIAIAFDAKPDDVTPLFSGDTIRIALRDYADGDQLPAAGETIAYTLAPKPSPPPLLTPIEREHATDLRMITYNVWLDAPWKPNQEARFGRQLVAVQPDIINFQEIYQHSAAQAAAFVEQWLPLSPGEQWHFVGNHDCKTISRYPILDSWPIDENIAVLIDTTEVLGTKLLVINAHLPCCTHDHTRQMEIDAIMAFIRSVKQFGHLINIDPGTPIVLAGDLNLVGYSQQLDTLLKGDIVNQGSHGPAFDPDWDGSNLTSVVPRQTEKRMGYTWRNDFSSFAPGHLDYFIFTDSVLEQGRHFTLYTPEMSSQVLEAHGLVSTDSLASDHLLFCADFRKRQSVIGDLNGDGVVDVSDLLILLGMWGTCADPGDCPADLNGDGAVDVSDLLILLANWG